MISELKKIKFALIIADENELKNLEEFQWNLLNSFFLKNKKIWIYEKNNNKILIIHSGIGLVNAASATQILLDHLENLKAIFSHGAVGAFSNELKIYDVVIPEKIYFYDVHTPWYKYGQIPGEKEFYFNSLKENDSQISNLNLGSGNSFLFDSTIIKNIQKEIPVNIFDMEAAAIAQICSQNKIELFLVKAVSDKIGENVEHKDDINLRISNAAKFSLSIILKKIESFFN